MRNTENYSLKKCIFMTLDEFDDLILELTKGLMCVEYEPDGFFYSDTEKTEEIGIRWDGDIEETLSKYFDVTVTSVHADDCDEPGIWVCYKE